MILERQCRHVFHGFFNTQGLGDDSLIPPIGFGMFWEQGLRFQGSRGSSVGILGWY